MLSYMVFEYKLWILGLKYMYICRYNRLANRFYEFIYKNSQIVSIKNMN